MLFGVPLLFPLILTFSFISFLLVGQRSLSVPLVLVQELDLLVVLHFHLSDLGHLLHLLPLSSLLHLLLLPFLSLKEFGADLLGPAKVNRVVSNEPRNGFSAVIYLGQLNEQRNQIKELSVLGIIVPTDDWHSALWLQHIGAWTVVQNHCILHISAEFAHILGENAVDIGTVLSEEPHSAESLRVHLVHQWVCVL